MSHHYPPPFTAFWRDRRVLALRVVLLSLGLLFASLAVYAAPGDLDPTFDGDGMVITPMGTGDSVIWEIAVQSDGKLVAGGQALNGANGYDVALARYNTDGSLDSTFNVTGTVLTTVSTADDIIGTLTLQSDGKIVGAGYMSNTTNLNLDIVLVRYNTNGTLDAAFDGDGIVTTDIGNTDQVIRDAVIQSDGKIVVAGWTDSGANGSDFVVVRYNTNGALDATFDGDGIVVTDFNGGDDSSYGLTLQSDGKIVVVGQVTNGANGLDVGIARYNANGALDATFDGDGKVITTLSAAEDWGAMIVQQSNGKLVVSGKADVGGSFDAALLRYNTDGSLDNTFDGDGKVITNIGAGDDLIYDLLLQPNGKIVGVGGSNDGSLTNAVVLRYNPNGALDATFGGGDGIVITPLSNLGSHFWTIARQVDSKLVVAGEAGVVNSDADFAVARYLNDGTPPTTTLTLNPAAPNGGGGLYLPPVHVSVSAVDGESIVAETRCVLDPVSAPAGFNNLPVGCAYTGLGADVSAPGAHTVYAASRDSAGNLEAPVSVSFTIAQPTATPTPTLTDTPTLTPTPSNTSTPSLTPTGTVPTPTPTTIPSNTATPTFTPTATVPLRPTQRRPIRNRASPPMALMARLPPASVRWRPMPAALYHPAPMTGRPTWPRVLSRAPMASP
ncbi:MAG: hypothetical protein R3A44_25530 [Caldilineaceae bacterium]